MALGEAPAERDEAEPGRDPLFVTIQEELRRRVEAGIYPEGQRIPGSRDLAREFATTTVTVDKALSRLVERGYIHRRARIGSVVNPRRFWNTEAVKTYRSGLIGALFYDTTTPWFWTKALRGIEDALNENDHHLVICNSDGSTQKSLQYVEDLVRKGIDGLIIAPFGMPTPGEYELENLKVLKRVDDLEVPRILFHRYLEGRKDSVVTTDSRGDTAALVRRMLRAGVRSPVCVAADYYASDVAERERGFRDALEGIFPDLESRIIRADPGLANARGLEGADLWTRDDIDGVFAVNATVLLSAIRRIQSDPRLAGKVAFASYDQVETAERGQILMSVVEPAYEMGFAAGELIADKARRRRGATIVQIQFPCEIQDGDAPSPGQGRQEGGPMDAPKRDGSQASSGA